MKNLLRSDGVQAFLGWVLGTYLRVVLKTVRWRHENLACVEPVLADDAAGAIALFWHGRIPLCLATAPQWWRKRTKCLISPSADGEFIARALDMSGFPAIRVSSAKKGDTAKARQAVAAIREATGWVKGGGALVVTPDGPRGPNEVMQSGAAAVARVTGAPVLLAGLACKPAIRLGSWDGAMIPVPFGRAAMVWDGPHLATRSDDVEAVSADWGARLAAATRRAEALLEG